MPRIGILQISDETVDCERTDIKDQLENILDDPDIFRCVDVASTDAMLECVNRILKPVVAVSLCNICDTIDTIYTGYFVDASDIIAVHEASIAGNNAGNMGDVAKNKPKITFNRFASQITHQNVSGCLVIVKQSLEYQIQDNNVKTQTQLADLSQYETVSMLESVYIKHGVVVGVDGTMQTYKYITNPLEHVMLSDSHYAEHYVYHEYEVYTHVMMIIVDTRECNGVPNHIATWLAGRPVNGTVFVAMYKKPDYNETPPYATLSVKKLRHILEIRQKSVSLTTGMQRSEREYVNFEKLLELECVKHDAKPNVSLSDIHGELLNIGTPSQAI